MMRRSLHTVAVATSVTHQLDRESMEGDVVADLLEGSRVAERGDAVGPGLDPLPGHRRRHAHHVLLRHAGVDEIFSQGRLQWLQGHEAKIAGHEDQPVRGGAGHHGITELLSHDAVTSISPLISLSISLRACLY